MVTVTDVKQFILVPLYGDLPFIRSVPKGQENEKLFEYVESEEFIVVDPETKCYAERDNEGLIWVELTEKPESGG